jgi:hypothetical protein
VGVRVVADRAEAGRAMPPAPRVAVVLARALRNTTSAKQVIELVAEGLV